MKNQIALADLDISYVDKKGEKNPSTQALDVITIMPPGKDIL